MKLLLDTCVVSELIRPRAVPAFRANLAKLDEYEQYLSVVTLGELAKGAHLLPPGKRQTELAVWFNDLQSRYGDRILPIDRDTALTWGDLTARCQKRGVQISASDGLIAATALRHELHIVTRNTQDFAASGAQIIDPWAI